MSKTRTLTAAKPFVSMISAALSTTISVVLLSTLLIASASAEITGNITLTSNYIFRGMDRSNNSPAVQGGYDWGHEAGIYAGVWASSVATGPEGSIEVDGYFGYTSEWQKYGVGMDVGFIHYRFPHISGETNEVYGVMSFKGFSGSLWYDLNDDSIDMLVDGEIEEVPTGGNANTFIYGNLAYEITLGPEIGISVAVGQQTFDTDFDKTGAEVKNRVDWSVGIDKEFFGIDFDLKYTDNNRDTDEKTEFIIFSLSKRL